MWFCCSWQIVLEEAGRPMHIKEIKQRIIDRGLVQSKYDSNLCLPHETCREIPTTTMKYEHFFQLVLELVFNLC